MSPAKPDKDWLDPPDWWKKWRPLRWLIGVLLLLGVWVALRPLLPEREPEVAKPRATAAARPTPQATPVSTPAPAPSEPLASASPEPTASATPAPAQASPIPSSIPSPTPTPSPVPAADTSSEVSEQEAQVYYEESLGQAPAESEIAAFTRVASDPVAMLGRYRSFQSVDEVVFGLEQAGFEPIVESRHATVRDGIPPRDLDTVTVTQYRHWDVPGRLQLQFFNDRLLQAEFEPEDAARYKAAQQRELPQLKREESGRSELIVGHLRIASSLDLAVSEVGRKLGTRPFLIWQDRRLVRQRDEWDRRFALDAVP
ncbi:MAG: hypothetical protein VYC42_16700 [Pseudomonadota bacterium]|nr:hypothetical protein [Pseudomonadota bacterium]